MIAELLSSLNRILHEMLGQLAKHELSLASNPVPPAELGHLIDAVSQSKLNCEYPSI